MTFTTWTRRIVAAALAAALGLTTGLGPAAALDRTPLAAGGPRLAQAPAATQQRTYAMRDLGRLQNWTFTPGLTEAFETPLSESEPSPQTANREAVTQGWNRAAQRLLAFNHRVSAAAIERYAAGPARYTCDAAAASCSYQQFMTPIRNQGRCSSCWVFATLGAWEGTYALRYGIRVDASEQQVLTCTGRGNSCAGGFWGDALALMSATPIGAETTQPYTAKAGSCRANPASPYKVAAWGFINTANTPPSVATLKQALAERGPIIAGIYATPAFAAYTGGVFNEMASGGIDHAVVIIGWDDRRGAWRVRNSRGAQWGEAGYAWVAYGTNNIGAWATWVRPAAPGANQIEQTTLRIAALREAGRARLGQVWSQYRMLR